MQNNEILIHPDKVQNLHFSDFVEPRVLMSSISSEKFWNSDPQYNAKPFGNAYGCFKTSERLLRSKRNPFVDSIVLSYLYHIPLILSPENIWLAIQQGFSAHMKINAETLRKKFVEFEGKEKLEVNLDYPNFIFDKDGDWSHIFSNFKSQIKSNVKANSYNMLSAKFSTTNDLQEQIFDISMMDILQCFFEYDIKLCGCGIPKVKFTGCLEDWQQIRTKLLQFDDYLCGDWVNALLPIIDKLIDAVKGEVDVEFWDCAIKVSPSWASEFLTRNFTGADAFFEGWVLNFFPYDIDKNERYMMNVTEMHTLYENRAQGLNVKTNNRFSKLSIPTGLQEVPLKINLQQIDESFNMTLRSGFVGISYSEEGYISAAMGWATYINDEDETLARPKIDQYLIALGINVKDILVEKKHLDPSYDSADENEVYLEAWNKLQNSNNKYKQSAMYPVFSQKQKSLIEEMLIRVWKHFNPEGKEEISYQEISDAFKSLHIYQQQTQPEQCEQNLTIWSEEDEEQIKQQLTLKLWKEKFENKFLGQGDEIDVNIQTSFDEFDFEKAKNEFLDLNNFEKWNGTECYEVKYNWGEDDDEDDGDEDDDDDVEKEKVTTSGTPTERKFYEHLSHENWQKILDIFDIDEDNQISKMEFFFMKEILECLIENNDCE